MDYQRYTVDDFLLDDSFLAHCRGSDPEAVAFWTHWQQTPHPNRPAFYEAERLFRMLTAEKPRLDDSLAELEALIAQQQPEATAAKVLPMPVSRSRAWRGWAVAASVLLVSVLGLLGYRYWSDTYQIYQTAYNQQQTVDLPDGSTVRLNSHSVLRYRPGDFSGQMRRVELEGEGFFSVQHTASDAPFRVVTSGAFDVQVLGTEFTATYRPSAQRVVLNTGRVLVRFHDRRPDLTLKPGELVELRADTKTVQQRTVRPEQYNAWTRNQLVFENATIAEVIQTVEDQFGVTVRVENADIQQRTFTGVLPIQTPEAVLNAVAQLNRLTLKKTDNAFVLSQ